MLRLQDLFEDVDVVAAVCFVWFSLPVDVSLDQP